jgi:small-conductance mechanosensitive channel
MEGTEATNTAASTALLDKLFRWGEANVWNVGTLIEIAVMLSCYLAGALIATTLHARATKAIEKSQMPLRTKRIAKNVRRAILPACVLVIIFAASFVLSSEYIGIDVSLMVAVMKVLSAWIAIRLALQFVENAVIRNIFTWVIWTIAALSIFGVFEQTMTALDAFGFTLGNFRVSALEIVKSVLMLIILLYLALFVSTFFERKVLKSKNLSRSSQVLIVKIIRIVLIVFAVIIGITSAGIDLSVFAVFGGAIGLGIGFGLQKSVSNLFSGMLLLMDQSIKPGDIIELDQLGTFGFVNQMAARYTEVVTRDNKSYLIPNEDFITQRVVNWSHGNSLVRLEIPFGVHYRSDPHQVIKIALDIAKKFPRIVADPEPQCFLKEFGDSAINFKLQLWLTDVEHGVSNITSDVLLGLWDAFKAADIEIPYPHREIYLHQK